ncbi:MAG: single-stranded-DNA-specific exonuclease RecJ [Candidatus Portnoybacteria bacterium]|nr:single-stranded-DNA-specific exonuclease RecJ [Candidatus Portnoybacteria bacterium]
MNWLLKPKAPKEFIGQFPEYSPMVLQLLYSRGLKTQKEIDEFFNPDYKEDLHDPFLMLGVKEAVKRILKAVKKQEKITIFGDYDADGVCGALILKSTLEALGACLGEVQIPDRINDGYGLNSTAIKKIAKENTKLIVTVDCGITDVAEVKLANSLKMEVIIVDHHQLGKKLPSAKVIIDPFQKGDKYPFKTLAGAGVAFKLVQALIKEGGQKIKEGFEKWLLDLVALATVADCVPLIGENRTLVRYGLIVLAQTQRIGLQELMKIARLDPVFEAETMTTNLNSYALGFMLAPRLNAAGRIKHANLAFRLLESQEREKARELAQEIDNFNRQRQKITDDIVAQVEERIKSYINDPNYPIIIEGDQNWSAGIVGLVAGKISDKYQRPTIILNHENGLSRGSARSLPAFNIIEALKDSAEFLKDFGGHPVAAGLSLKKENLPLFREKINQFARAKIKPEDLAPVLEIETEIAPKNINWELFDNLVKFEPFGNGNRDPVFMIKDLEIVNSRLVGNGSKHLKLELKGGNPNNKIFKAIGFRLAKNGNENLKAGDKVDLAFELIVDEWNGNRDLQLRIIDIKQSL